MSQVQLDATDTATQILDVAERLVQTRGFNGFSYADIAKELAISTASLHYHFAGKAKLGVALIDRYASRFDQALASLEASVTDAPAKIAGYEDLYFEVLRHERMCLCGILAAEIETLPAPMHDAVIGYFNSNEKWLERVLEQGRSEGTLEFQRPALEVARSIDAGLQGAMLVARSYGDIVRFEVVASHLLAELVIGNPASRVSRG